MSTGNEGANSGIGDEILKEMDNDAASVQKTPNRVTLEYIESRIIAEEYLHPKNCPHLTICVLLVDNGFTVIGKAGVADPDNFNEELGKKISRRNAINELWGYFGFLLTEDLYKNLLANFLTQIQTNQTGDE